MGSGASLPGENQTAQIDPSTEGFHVLQVQDKSPGYNAGIEPYFDFIVSANENRLDQENNILSKILESNLNQEIRLYIYSIKTRDIRVVRVVPDDQWGGRGLLGLSIRYCTFSNLEETVWHVQDVIPGSPAANAGLLSDKDYIVGADANIHAPEDIFAFIENNNLNTIRLYVYNHLMDQTRMVLLTPNSDWGGPGFIGCQLSYGYLHRIPAQAKPEKHIPIVGTSDEKFSSVFSNDISTSNNDDSMNLKNAVASTSESSVTQSIQMPDQQTELLSSSPITAVSTNTFNFQPSAFPQSQGIQSTPPQESHTTPTAPLLFPSEHPPIPIGHHFQGAYQHLNNTPQPPQPPLNPPAPLMFYDPTKHYETSP